MLETVTGCVQVFSSDEAKVSGAAAQVRLGDGGDKGSFVRTIFA